MSAVRFCPRPPFFTNGAPLFPLNRIYIIHADGAIKILRETCYTLSASTPNCRNVSNLLTVVGVASLCYFYLNQFEYIGQAVKLKFTIFLNQLCYAIRMISVFHVFNCTYILNINSAIRLKHFNTIINIIRFYGAL